jgi:hypothetical protein
MDKLPIKVVFIVFYRRRDEGEYEKAEMEASSWNEVAGNLLLKEEFIEAYVIRKDLTTHITIERK